MQVLRKVGRFVGHLEWLRFGIRDRIVRRIHNPDTSRPEKFSIGFFGATYNGNFNSYIDWSAYYYGAYAREELRLIDEFLKTADEPVFIDVGANVGHHTVFAAMRSKMVYAFEPFPVVAVELEEKVAVNNFSNVHLSKVALGETDQIGIYKTPNTHNTGTGSFVDSKTSGDTVNLQIKNGDGAISELNLKKVDLIKIDTEGYEPFVLKGLNKTLARYRPLVFFEWTQGERRPDQQNWDSLFPEDYKIFQFVDETVVLALFRRRSYRLRELPNAHWPDGYLFALPDEYIRSLKTNAPLSAAAARI